MRIDKPMMVGELVRRYKRFLADVRLKNGEILTVHCPNSGSMTGCAIPGARAYISDSQNPKRKLRYTLEILETDSAMICVNTQRANGLVEEAIRHGYIPELDGFLKIEREVPYGVENSRIDLLLRGANTNCFVEVKNVTLGGDAGVVSFPDAVTKRGTKHLRELSSVVDSGDRAALVYCVARTDAVAVTPAWSIDPVYSQTLKDARRRGVEVYALKLEFNLPNLFLKEPLVVRM